MVYIVSDERIATENFEQGKIYKVDFVDESILYGVCIGIGSDFVMLSGDISGYIFALTMQTASQVSSIDLYDPTPPVPWTNLLQYQTEVPPFEFTTTDTSLFSWYIVGDGVGDKTDNLYQFPYTLTYSLSGSGNNRTVVNTAYIRSNIIKLKPNTTYYFAGQRAQAADNYGRIALFTDEPEVNSVSTHFYSFRDNGSTTFTTDATENYALVYLAQPEDYNINYNMILYEGSAKPYEPYGKYKIAVICNENTTNIYLDAPLSEGEILYSTDIDTAIVTDIGENELTVGTTQQPTSMQIVYKIADR